MRTRIGAVAAVWLAAGGAAAQATLGDAEPLDRSGVRLGTVVLEPTITIGARHDDNIFRSETNRRASTILNARAALAARTDWSRHSLALDAAVEAEVFTNSSPDDVVDAEAAATGVLDVSRAFRARLRAGTARRHERRGDDDAPASLTGPVREHAVFADLTGQYAPGRLKIQPRIGVERRNFDDRGLIGGGVGDQDDRDRVIYAGAVEVGYNLPGPTALVAEARLARVDFDEPFDRNGEDRDNTRFSFLAGIEIEDEDRILSGAVLAGYRKRWSDDPIDPDVSGPALEARVLWKPSPVFSLEATGASRVEETTIAGASAAEVTFGGLRGAYEVQRFVDLVANAAYERRSFRGASRRDETVSLGAALEWRARETTLVRLGYRHIDEDSTAAGESSRANIFFLTVEHAF